MGEHVVTTKEKQLILKPLPNINSDFGTCCVIINHEQIPILVKNDHEHHERLSARQSRIYKMKNLGTIARSWAYMNKHIISFLARNAKDELV
jgi:hypothetical protein